MNEEYSQLRDRSDVISNGIILPSNIDDDDDDGDDDNGDREKTTRFLIVVGYYHLSVFLSATTLLSVLKQDDSALNRKMAMRIISTDQQGERFGVVDVIEADDGSTAVEALRSEMAAGRPVDFVLMDFVMVG